jgi:hypothetical protein
MLGLLRNFLRLTSRISVSMHISYLNDKTNQKQNEYNGEQEKEEEEEEGLGGKGKGKAKEIEEDDSEIGDPDDMYGSDMPV